LLWKCYVRADILDRFSAVVCGDEVTNGKPAPDIFLLAAEKLGVSPSACASFEDLPAGLMGLHSTGIRSIIIKEAVELFNL
jgi:HAD superfamily hydrolase (TIGR01509 family)